MMSILPWQPVGATSPKSGTGSLVLTAVSSDVEEETSLDFDDEVEKDVEVEKGVEVDEDVEVVALLVPTSPLTLANDVGSAGTAAPQPARQSVTTRPAWRDIAHEANSLFRGRATRLTQVFAFTVAPRGTLNISASLGGARVAGFVVS